MVKQLEHQIDNGGRQQFFPKAFHPQMGHDRHGDRAFRQSIFVAAFPIIPARVLCQRPKAAPVRLAYPPSCSRAQSLTGPNGWSGSPLTTAPIGGARIARKRSVGGFIVYQMPRRSAPAYREHIAYLDNRASFAPEPLRSNNRKSLPAAHSHSVQDVSLVLQGPMNDQQIEPSKDQATTRNSIPECPHALLIGWRRPVHCARVEIPTRQKRLQRRE